MDIKLPPGLTSRAVAFPTVFLDIHGLNIDDPAIQEEINDALFRILCECHDAEIAGQALLKVHIGEPQVITRILNALEL